MKNWSEKLGKTRYLLIGITLTLLIALWLISKIVR